MASPDGVPSTPTARIFVTRRPFPSQGDNLPDTTVLADRGRWVFRRQLGAWWGAPPRKATWSLDITFDPTGGGEWEGLAGGSASVNALARQPDGRVLVAGNFTSINGIRRLGLARLQGNGLLDLTFAPDPDLHFEIRALAVQPDGKVLLGGMGERGLGDIGEGAWFLIETSTDLVEWAPMATVMNAAGEVEFMDPQPAASGHRFYRAIILP